MLKIFRVSELCSIILTKILRINFFRKYLVFFLLPKCFDRKIMLNFGNYAHFRKKKHNFEKKNSNTGLYKKCTKRKPLTINRNLFQTKK